MNKVDYSKLQHRRYHKDIYLPDNFVEMAIEFFEQLPFVHLTNHSIEEIRKDRNGIIPIPSIDQLSSKDSYMVEFYCPMVDGIPQDYIQKMLIRVRNLSDFYDYSYIIAREGFLISAWSNKKSDIHKLKNSQNYYNPSRTKNDNTNRTN